MFQYVVFFCWLIFGKLFHATFLHIINMCTFGLFIHSYVICTSTCARICQIICLKLFQLHINMCTHLWIIHSQLFHSHTNMCTHLLDYSSITISVAHQHVHTSFGFSSITVSFAHQHVHTSSGLFIYSCSYAYQLILTFGVLHVISWIIYSHVFTMHINQCTYFHSCL